MAITLSHSVNEFRKNEIATLEYVRNRAFFNDDFEELANAVTSYYDRYKGQKGSQNFKFVADYDMKIEKQDYRVILHAEVSGNYAFTSYSLGICAKGSNELIRRFHFDYDHSANRTKQKAPISHLQYGGKCGPGHSGNIYLTTNLVDTLSEPRLSHPPINLAILLDMVFCEFYDHKTRKIVENSQWRSLIMANEVFVFRDYFREIANHIDSPRHTKDKLIRDIYYGN